MLREKSSHLGSLNPIGPDPGEDDLAAIKAFALTDLDPSRLYVRRVTLANDAPDRQHEIIPKDKLDRLAATLTGKSLLHVHDKKTLGLGLWHMAQVRPSQAGEAGSYTLEARFYLVKSPENQELRDKIDAGVVRHTSISFAYPERQCLTCMGDADTCPHIPGEPDGKGGTTLFRYAGDPAQYETKEASLVFLGAQKGSIITKTDERTLPMEELEKAKARIAELEKELKTREKHAYDANEMAKSLDEANAAAKKHQDEAEAAKAQVEALKSDTATKALVADGQAYRAHLQSEVKRLAGILHREKQVEPILHLTAAAGTEALKSLHDGLLSEVEEKYPTKPIGLPMSTDKDETEKTSSPTGTPFSLL